MNVNLTNSEIMGVKELLNRFQEGYTKRDKSIIDNYMKDIFEQSDRVVILGTSDEEWCLGYEEAKELVESDWEYWGDVRLDVDNSNIVINDNVAWVTLKGNIKYEFEDSENKYNRYLEVVKEHLKNEGEFKDMPSKVRLLKIEHLISSLMRQRKDNKRIYYWPLSLSGVAVKNENGWRFRYMQFTLPTIDYPEVRMKTDCEYEDNYKETNEKLKSYITKNTVAGRQEIEELINCFTEDYLNSQIEEEKIVKEYFLDKEDICLLDANYEWYNGEIDIQESIKAHRDKWDSFKIESELAIINVENDMAWVAAGGVINKKMTEEEAMLKELKKIEAIEDKDIPAEHKLSQIHRNIIRALMETSMGEDYIWPCRFEAMLIKENGIWKLHTVQFSFSFYWILEDKYDVPASNK